MSASGESLVYQLRIIGPYLSRQSATTTELVANPKWYDMERGARGTKAGGGGALTRIAAGVAYSGLWGRWHHDYRE